MPSTTLTSAGFTRESFEAFLAQRDEPGWLCDLRRSAWEQFESLPMPARSDEEWMRTDIRLFRLDRFSTPGEASATGKLPTALLRAGVELSGRASSLNSQPVETSLSDELAAKGVLFGSLDELVGEHGDLLRPFVERRVIDPGYDKFSALHSALWAGGSVLYVPKGVRVERPLHALSAMTDGGVDFSKTLVILEQGAEATLLSELASTGVDDGGFHCGMIELIVEPEARLRYVNLQNWGSGVWHFAHQKAHVARGANLQWTIGALGARLAKVNQHVALTGQDAEAQVNGVMFTHGKQHLSYNTHQHHQAPYCRSDLLYKAALQDHSRTVWRGMIKVDEAAQRTDAYQRNDNLMLSRVARADSIPGLEIEADDVRCTHGSTAGRVDDDQVFYAMTRGYTRTEAVRMIVAGFFQQVFDRIAIESVREALGRAIGDRVRAISE
ncbi:MAG: Fe-S cluster assembly protein SufD [Planctomycetales bacterium]|nr:Fe-S cluster assembly protein SufD [Planctomycetales bacterium]